MDNNKLLSSNKSNDKIFFSLERNGENILFYNGFGKIEYKYDKDNDGNATLVLKLFPSKDKNKERKG